MTEVKVKKLLDLQNPLWGFENLITLSDKKIFRESINKITKDNFQSPMYGNKLYLTSYNKKILDSNLFEADVFQRLMNIFDDLKFIEYIGNLLYKSNSSIIEHLEYHKILNESNKYKFIDDLANKKFKIQPNCGIGRNNENNPWKQISCFKKEQIKELILSENFIPYYPTFEISRIDYGGRLLPHTDQSEKIASFMIYLPKNTEESDSPLGTIFWKPKPLNTNNSYLQTIEKANEHLAGENLKRFNKKHDPIRTKFQNQFTLLFFRSATSWHSFEHDQKEVGSRLSININFMFPMIN